MSRRDPFICCPGDESGAALLDQRVARTRAKRNGYAAGMVVAAIAGIVALILAAALAGQHQGQPGSGGCCCGCGSFLWKQQLKYARELQKRMRMKGRWLSRQEKLKWNRGESSAGL